jgi:4-hydroxy-tetrahydrodipicolinate synthase
LYELTLLAFEEGNPAGIKHMLQELNLVEANLRLPLVPVTEELAKRIKQEMEVVKNYFQ